VLGFGGWGNFGVTGGEAGVDGPAVRPSLLLVGHVSPARPAAVDYEAVAGDVGGTVGEEKHCGADDFFVRHLSGAHCGPPARQAHRLQSHRLFGSRQL